MYGKDFDKLVDELIDVKAELAALEARHSALRDDYKGLEVSWHQLKDDYAQLARVIGVHGDSSWGDPLIAHADVIARAKELASFARMA